MGPGMRVDLLIGSVRIKEFACATEVLKGKVMTFVNQVAEIVHGLVMEYNGAVNANNGGSFLVAWRADRLEIDHRAALADMAMVAFARMVGAVHRSHVLSQYREHPGLQQRLGSAFRVDLSLALHFGWAIEGAVGSEFKINASYLSPNVNITDSIEYATRLYGVCFLASETVVRLCSPEMAAKCRLIDRVIIKGSKAPLELYAIDLDPRCPDLQRKQIPAPAWTVRTRFKVRQALEAEKQRKWNFAGRFADHFDGFDDVVRMRRCFSVEFAQLFNMGYQNYSEGEWQVARRLLCRTLWFLGERDGPSHFLLNSMESPHQYEAPEGWHGVHELQGCLPVPA